MPKLAPIGEAIKPVKKRDVVAEVFEAVGGCQGLEVQKLVQSGVAFS